MSKAAKTRLRVSTGLNMGELQKGVIERLPADDTVPAFDDLAAGYDGWGLHSPLLRVLELAPAK